MGRKFLLLSSSLLACALLSGCGPFLYSPYTTGPTGPTGPPVPLDLNGNWLITGDLPVLFDMNSEPAGQLNFAATLFVQNNQLSGGSVFSMNCPSGGSFGKQNFPISGTVDSDGNFTAQVGRLLNGESLTFSGKAPSSEGGTWTGSLTYTNGFCAVTTITKSFKSTALGAVTGTYTGTTTLGSVTHYPPSNVAIAMQLQQGAVAGSQSLGYGLTGSVNVTGSPCFHSGTIVSGGSPSEVEGNGVNFTFVMDDGSTFSGIGQFTDLAASMFTVTSAMVAGGSCDGEHVGALILQR